MLGMKEGVTLNDIPEGIRSLFAVVDGIVSLDETKVKTVEDVQNALNAKDHEKADHAKTKTALDVWKKLGKTPEEIQAILDEYPSLKEGGKTNEDYLNEKRGRTKAERELAELQKKYDENQATIKELTEYKTAGLKMSAWRSIRQKLSEKYDGDKLDVIYEDNAGKFLLNDIGEFEPVNGKPVAEFIEARAKMFGAELKNTPGASHPGAGRLPDNLGTRSFTPFVLETDNFMDEDAITQGNR